MLLGGWDTPYPYKDNQCHYPIHQREGIEGSRQSDSWRNGTWQVLCIRLWRTPFLAYPPQVIQWRAKGTQIIKGWILRIWRREFTEYGRSTFSRECLKWLPRAEKAHDKKSFRIVVWWWAEMFTAPCPMRKSIGFSPAPRNKDGTNNHSRRTDGVMRSANLPTAPFFRELRADKKRSKDPPMKPRKKLKYRTLLELLLLNLTYCRVYH